MMTMMRSHDENALVERERERDLFNRTHHHTPTRECLERNNALRAVFRDETVYVVYHPVVYVKVVRESFIVRLEGTKSSLQLLSSFFPFCLIVEKVVSSNAFILSSLSIFERFLSFFLSFERERER